MNQNQENTPKKGKHPFLVFLIAFLILLILFSFLKMKRTMKNPPAEIQSLSEKKEILTESSGEDSETSENVDQKGAEEDLPEEAMEESYEEGEGIFAGQAMAKADTGEKHQDAQGHGKNHNSASSRYAYKAADVKAAMAGEKTLKGPEKMAFLTYDDGVSSLSTPLLLEELEKEEVPATFFIVGNSILPKNKDLLLRIMEDGHAIGIHSYDHDYAKLYPHRFASGKEISRQAQLDLSALKDLLGEDFETHIWRYPGGHMSWKNMEEGDQALAQLGLDWIDWNAMSGDASRKDEQPKSTEEQVEHVLNDWNCFGQPDVVVVLMHDTPDKPLTRESLDAIVEALREKGFSFGILE